MLLPVHHNKSMSFAMENINCEFLACRLTNKTDMKYNNETHHNHPQIHHEIGATKNDKASQAAKKNRIPIYIYGAVFQFNLF